MARDYASFTTLVTTKLQSAGTGDFSAAEIDNGIHEGLKEFSTYHPHLVDVLFKVEGRYGTVSSTSANNLVDTTKGQFVAADATNEKVIHNTTENKRAVVLSQADTATVGLSADIMTVANAQYEVYNRFCWNHRQVYIGDVPQYLNIDSVEYPVGARRNFKLLDRVLEVDVDNIPDTNSNTAKVTNLPDDDILVRFNMPHQLSTLTDWAGVVAGTAAVAAATSLSATSLQSAGTIETGNELSIENHRSTYFVTTDATIASNTAVMSIYPPLEATASSTWVITFRKSSLEPQFEEIFADLVAARVAINKAPLQIRGTTAAISILATASSALASMTTQIAAATSYVASGSTETGKVAALITSAGSAIAKIDADIVLAASALAAGTAFMNAIPIGGDVAGRYYQSAMGDISVGRGYLTEAEGYIAQGRADEALSNNYGELSARSLANASQYLNESVGYIRRINAELAIAGSWRMYQDWGERKLAEALSKLRRNVPPKIKVRYPQD